MNDFFSVLDDFEIQEFVTAYDSDYVGSSFSIDSFDDSSSQVVPQEDLPYQQTAVDSVKTSGDDVTEDDVSAGTNYVWSGGTSPVTASNSANTYVSFSNYVRATNSEGVEYRIVSLKDIEGVSFAGDGTLDIDAATDVEITATGGVSLALNNGRVTNGSFLAGNGSITINTANADGGATTIAISDFSSEAVTFTSSNEDILTVETDQTTGTITINDDNFYLNGTQLRFKNVDWDNSGDGVKASYEDGVLTVDASTLVPTAGETIQVTSAGGANIFIPPTGANAIKLLGTTYTYANATGEAYFMVNNEAVDGFVLSGTNDSITIEKANALSVYSDEDITTPLANVTGKNYTITQTGVDTFQANILETSTIQINGSNTTLDFTISKATANTTAFRNAGGITITFDGDGEIQGVAGIARLTNTGDKMAVTGAAAYDETSGLPIITGNNRREYISIASGNFTLNGGTTQEIAVTTSDTVYSVYTGVELVTSEAAGTIVDGANNITYTYGGTGYFTADQNNNITGFIFNAANDYIVMPDDVVNFNVTYTSPTTGRQVAVPIPVAVNDADGYYRLTMSDTSGKFAISELSAGSSVNGITFAGTDGVVEFDSTGITGVKSTTGNITFDAVGSALLANAGFTINSIQLPAITTTEATYVFNGNRLETPATYYMFGTTNNYGNYTFANEEDQLVYFDVDANGNVTAIRALNGGNVQGDFTGTVTVNGQNIRTDDTDVIVTGNAAGDDIVAVDGLVGDMVLTAAESGLRINGDTVVFTFGNTTTSVVATGDANGLTTVSGFHTGDVVAASDDSVAFEFVTTGGTDNFTVNGELYTVTGDTDGSIFITGAGEVTGLDEDASLIVTPAADISVNDVPYTADEVNGESVIGYQKKTGDTISSYVTDAAHPLISSFNTQAELKNILGVAPATTYIESNDGSKDLTTVEGSAEYIFDTDGTNAVAFNKDAGKNLAIVDDTATGNKAITLGNFGDAVIMDGHDEYGSVNIIGGTGNDTIIVRGNVYDLETDAVYKGTTKTTIDLSQGGADKVITYAAANANIEINNYDEMLSPGAGIVFHDPEIPYIKDNIVDAINDGLLVFEGNKVVAIDRDETATGQDRKTQITVNNKNANHQTMVRLFGYKDKSDTYSDDFGQLVGFTSELGGTLDASDITNESVILIGNKDNNKAAGSYLKTGTADDTVFAGGMDTIDTGDGKDIIIMDDTADRKAATIIVGQGAGDAVQNLKSGFEGDIFDVTSYDGKLAYTFTDGLLAIVDESSKSSLGAITDETGQFIKQRFINGPETLYAAIAAEGGTITVTDDDSTVPNYFLANDGAIDFTGFSGDVGLDVDGEDLDYPSAINGVSASIGSAVNSLIGGSGTTIFKGGKGNETLVAGTGESSLYGGGGQNVLIGDTSSVKTGSVEFFNIGIHNGAQNSIVGFEFIENGGSNQATFDNLNLGLADGNEVAGVEANSDGSVSLVIKGGESGAFEKATIADAAGKEMLIDRGTDTETVAQIASSVVTVNNSYVDFYAATNDTGGATVQVGNIASTEIWLGGAPIDHDKKVADFNSSKFTVIDARNSGAEALMAGNELSNTIYGGLGTASMWGGEGNANDVMVGGSAHNEYYYEVGNGNDTILSARDGDVIHLGMSLDQINFDGTEMGANGIVVRFNDGGAGSLYIDGGAEVSFSFDDGTNVKANRQTGQFE